MIDANLLPSILFPCDAMRCDALRCVALRVARRLLDLPRATAVAVANPRVEVFTAAAAALALPNNEIVLNISVVKKAKNAPFLNTNASLWTSFARKLFSLCRSYRWIFLSICLLLYKLLFGYGQSDGQHKHQGSLSHCPGRLYLWPSGTCAYFIRSYARTGWYTLMCKEKMRGLATVFCFWGETIVCGSGKTSPSPPPPYPFIWYSVVVSWFGIEITTRAILPYSW